MLLMLPDGRVLGGVDVYIHLGFRVWWAWPLALLASIPGLHWCFGKLYAWVAANRYRWTGACESGQCEIGH
jgi:predicted DCC family thiol-disulfide oxidoreductase YuxK